MRLSNRLLSNAATTYMRLGTTFVLAVFFIWYVVGRIGMAGFGTIAFASAAFSISAAVEMAVRQGLLRELAAAIATGQAERIRKCLSSAVVFCAPAALVLVVVSLMLAALAYFGVFRTPADLPGLPMVLAFLFLCEGVHGGVRLMCAPYTQSLLAAQHVATDNFLMVVNRVTYALSAVIVFGWILPEASLAAKLVGFGISRATIQLLDVALGVWLAKRRLPHLKFERGAFDRAEFRSIVGTVWHTGQFTLLMNLNAQFVAIVINLFFGVSYNGLWQIVLQIGGGARMLGQGLLYGVEPLSAHMQEAGRRTAIVDLMMRTIRYQAAAILPAVAVLVLFMDPILNLWVAGRMAMDPYLAEAGISVARAVELIAVMAYIHLASQIVRGSTFGVERMLFGLGHVRSYSWFAKYAAVLNVGLAVGLIWYFETVIVAPVSLLITYLIFYPGIMLAAAKRRVGLPIARTLRRALPRPLVATAILCVPLILLRTQLAQLTLLSLLALAAGSGIAYGLLLYAIVFEADERLRINEIIRGRFGRRGA